MKVKSEELYDAWQVKNENDLDKLLADGVINYDTVSKKFDTVTLSLEGSKIMSFCWGDWLIFSEFGVKTVTNEKFHKTFSCVSKP